MDEGDVVLPAAGVAAIARAADAGAGEDNIDEAGVALPAVGVAAIARAAEVAADGMGGGLESARRAVTGGGRESLAGRGGAETSAAWVAGSVAGRTPGSVPR